MGISNTDSKASLIPTIPLEERAPLIIRSIEEYTTKLFNQTPGLKEYGDCRDGIRLQLILGCLDADIREPGIDKFDSITLKVVLHYYDSKHWENSTSSLHDLLKLIKGTSQRLDLMELEINRSIYCKNKTIKESPSCLTYACLYIDNNKLAFRIPDINIKLVALALVQSCAYFTRSLIGNIYGSKLLIDDANHILNESRENNSKHDAYAGKNESQSTIISASNKNNSHNSSTQYMKPLWLATLPFLLIFIFKYALYDNHTSENISNVSYSETHAKPDTTPKNSTNFITNIQSDDSTDKNIMTTAPSEFNNNKINKDKLHQTTSDNRYITVDVPAKYKTVHNNDIDLKPVLTNKAESQLVVLKNTKSTQEVITKQEIIKPDTSKQYKLPPYIWEDDNGTMQATNIIKNVPIDKRAMFELAPKY